MTGSAQRACWVGALVIVLALAGVVIYLRLWVWSYGPGSDSVAIWTLKARMLARDGDVFHPELVHPHYPLLLPALTAGVWSLLGHDGARGPQLVAVVFTALTVGALVGGVAGLRGWVPAAWAGLSLFLFPRFLIEATAENADVPLGALAVTGLASMAMAVERPGGATARLVVAGFCLGLTAITKIEGQLIVAVALLGSMLANGLRGDRRAAVAHLTVLLVGAAPALAALAWLNTRYTVSSPYLQPLGTIWVHAVSWERHHLILVALGDLLRQHPFLVLPTLFPVLGGMRSAWRQPAVTSVGLVVVLWLLGYYFVYLTTPYGLGWQLSTSLRRLAVQVWPSWLLAVFLALPRLSAEPERRAGGDA